ncbi:MAG: hypothetical protein KDK65_05475, partial [Chlamydiia bacterium]|nr:hypothetical protein [Chlamydiia bacterium]
ILIDRGAIAEAKNAILVNPKLASDVRGQELFARIAMIEGNHELADRLYANIEEESTEAKSYLARRAFAQKNWTKARQLTEELLQQYPSNVTLRENLEKIAQEKLKSGHPRHAG